MDTKRQRQTDDSWLASLHSGIDNTLQDEGTETGMVVDDFPHRTDAQWEAEVQRIALTMGIFQHGRQPARLTDWGLFLGGREDADDYEHLKTLGISASVNLAPRACAAGIPDWGADYPIDFRVLEVEAEDDENYPLLALHLAAVEEFIDKQRADGRSVLIHCFAGMNRSPALCAAYLIKREGMCLTDTVQLLNERRGEVLSNQNFVRQIVALARAEKRLA